jgi:cytochrome c-type biogenesis protein CcmH/NrfF
MSEEQMIELSDAVWSLMDDGLSESDIVDAVRQAVWSLMDDGLSESDIVDAVRQAVSAWTPMMVD